MVGSASPAASPAWPSSARCGWSAARAASPRPHELEVRDADGDRDDRVRARIIAAGSSRRAPGAARRPAGHGLDRRAGAGRGPRAAAGDRRRHHRPGDGDGLRRARRADHRRRDDRPADPGLRPRPGEAAAASASRAATRRSTWARRWRRSRPRDDGLRVSFEGDDAPEPRTFDRILVAVGRRPNGDRLGADAAGRGGRRARLRSRSTTSCAPTCRTSTPSATSPASRCSPTRRRHEGEVAAEVIAGHDVAFDARAIPSVAYTDPEIAWIGLTETEAARRGHRLRGRHVPLGGLRPRAGARPRRRGSPSSSSSPRPAAARRRASSASTPAS